MLVAIDQEGKHHSLGMVGRDVVHDVQLLLAAMRGCTRWLRIRIGRNLRRLVPLQEAQFYSRRFTVSQIEPVLFRGAEALTRINEQIRRRLLSAGAEASKQQDEEESHVRASDRRPVPSNMKEQMIPERRGLFRQPGREGLHGPGFSKPNVFWAIRNVRDGNFRHGPPLKPVALVRVVLLLPLL